jgi:alginate O-acetyltransferase complex protein AlgI
MDVPSLPFLVFALIGALAFNLWSNKLFAQIVMLAMNVAFFCFFVRGFWSAVPYSGFLALGYVFVTLLTRRANRGLFNVALVLTILSFFWLKRYAFIPSFTFPSFDYTTIGLSYVFFRVLHLVIDAGQGALTERISPLSYINYTLNFTSLVSGPIQLYPDYRRSVVEQRYPLDLLVIGQAVERIVVGFFKVVVISRVLHTFQTDLITNLDPHGSFWNRTFDCALIGACYPFFLYTNFSGYTDFVIGIARLFKLKLPENFDRPFLSENFIGFWSRWHITLSNWLKMYVYTPLLMALMRRFPSITIEPYLGVVAYFVTFFLVGAWHGQTSEFLFFGLLQGGGVAANKLYQVLATRWLTRKGYRALTAQPVYIAFSMGLTFTWFAFTLLWFWSSWGQLADFVTNIGLAATMFGWLIVLLLSCIALFTYRALSRRLTEDEANAKQPVIPESRYRRTVMATMMAVLIAATEILFSSPAEIVYKNF